MDLCIWNLFFGCPCKAKTFLSEIFRALYLWYIYIYTEKFFFLSPFCFNDIKSAASAAALSFFIVIKKNQKHRLNQTNELKDWQNQHRSNINILLKAEETTNKSKIYFTFKKKKWAKRKKRAIYNVDWMFADCDFFPFRIETHNTTEKNISSTYSILLMYFSPSSSSFFAREWDREWYFKWSRVTHYQFTHCTSILSVLYAQHFLQKEKAKYLKKKNRIEYAEHISSVIHMIHPYWIIWNRKKHKLKEIDIYIIFFLEKTQNRSLEENENIIELLVSSFFFSFVIIHIYYQWIIFYFAIHWSERERRIQRVQKGEN